MGADAAKVIHCFVLISRQTCSMIVLLYAALLGKIFGHFLHLDADSTMKACSIISFTNPYLFIDSTK